ncbi:MAG: insulinase family protein [Bdellovibrio sp.]|nr:insulinase family protein [Bdellovibrio sp.]
MIKKESSNAPQKLPLVGSLQVYKYKFSNGLKLLVLEDHSSPTFAYQTWYGVGSRDEVKGHTGLAHLFEHMMFKGTKNHKEGEFFKLMKAVGSEGENAFTSKDYTAYVQELPKEHLEFIAQLESDRMQNLIVDDAAFTTEREVVQNERRFSYENNPDGLMYQEIFGLAFTEHSYHWPTIGYEEDLSRMAATEASQFYKNFYAPNKATIIVTGDIKHDEVYNIIKKHYEKIQTSETLNIQQARESTQTTPRRKIVKFNIQIEKLYMGYPVPEILHEDIPALQVLGEILAGGKSSRLYRALVNTGVSSDLESGVLENTEPSLFLITTNLQKNKKAAFAESIILREIQRLIQEPIAQKEHEKVQNRMSFAFYEGLSHNSSLARFLGKYEVISGNFEEGVKLFQKSLVVNAEDIKKAAKKYLIPDHRSVIIGVMK